MDKREGLFHLTLALVRRIDAQTVAVAQRGLSKEATTLNELANKGLLLAEDINNLEDIHNLEEIYKRYEEFRKDCK